MQRRAGYKDQVHAVLAKLGIPVSCSGLFGVWGSTCKEARNIAKTAAARHLLTAVFYAMRDGHARCLARPPATQAA